MFHRATQVAGLVGKHYTPPQPSAGGASFCFQARVPLEHIKKHGTWTSQAVDWYLLQHQAFQTQWHRHLGRLSLDPRVRIPMASSPVLPPGTQVRTFKAPGPVPATVCSHPTTNHKLLCFILAPQQGPNIARLGTASMWPLHKLLCFIFKTDSGLARPSQFCSQNSPRFSPLCLAGCSRFHRGSASQNLPRDRIVLARVHPAIFRLSKAPNFVRLGSASQFAIMFHNFSLSPVTLKLAVSLQSKEACLAGLQTADSRPSGRQVPSIQPSAQQPGFQLSYRSSIFGLYPTFGVICTTPTLGNSPTAIVPIHNITSWAYYSYTTSYTTHIFWRPADGQSLEKKYENGPGRWPD